MTSAGWLAGAGELPAAAIRELVSRAADTDGVAAVSGHVLDALTDGRVHGLLRPAGPDSSQLLGVAVALADDPAEVVVDPLFRGRGIGLDLVRAAVDRQGRVWLDGNLPPAVSVAAALGLTPVRELLQMRRDMAADVAATSDRSALPAGVRVRAFVPGQDEEAFLAVNARAFAWHPEQGRLDLEGLRAEMQQDWFDPAGFFLAVSRVDGLERVIGFHWTKVHDGPAPVGEVYVLGVDPAAGVHGLGGPLTEVGLAYLRWRGLPAVILYVEGDNHRAVRLYERFGFRTSVRNVVYARSVTGTS